MRWVSDGAGRGGSGSARVRSGRQLPASAGRVGVWTGATPDPPSVLLRSLTTSRLTALAAQPQLQPQQRCGACPFSGALLLWPLPSVTAEHWRSTMPRHPLKQSCGDLAAEGLFQGLLTGSGFGLFFALHQRRLSPEPNATKQVTAHHTAPLTSMPTTSSPSSHRVPPLPSPSPPPPLPLPSPSPPPPAPLFLSGAACVWSVGAAVLRSAVGVPRLQLPQLPRSARPR